MGPREAASYLVGWLQAYAASHPGYLLGMARSNRSVAVSLVGEVLANPLAGLVLVSYGPTLRELVSRHASAVADAVLQSLQGMNGELGQLARHHPQWVRQEVLVVAREVGRRL